MKKRNLGAAAVVLAALLLLSSCSDTAKMGAAFTVGSVRMSESDLTALVEESQAAQKDLGVQVSAASDITSGAVNAHIWQAIIDSAAAERKVTATQSEISDILNGEYQKTGKDQVQGQLASIGYPPRVADDYARLVLLQNKVSKDIADGKMDATAQAAVEKFWRDKVKSLNITVAPRYGTWDPEAMQVTPPKNPTTNSDGNGNQVP